MTYTGAMVLPQNAVVMQEEEMRYVEGGATVTVKFTKAFIRDTVTAVIGAVCTIIGTAIGTAVGSSVVGGAIGGAIGVVVGGKVSRRCIKKGFSFKIKVPKLKKNRTVYI
jgi:membrane protein DedA with SNARE-associated domain